MVDDVLISQRSAEHPLGHHRRNAVLDLGLDLTIIEAAGEPPHQADPPIGGAEQQRPASEVASPPSKTATTWRPSTS